MLAVQKDIYSAFSQFLAGQLVAAYEQRNAHNPGLDPAVALLRTWNGQMDKDQAAPFLVTLAYQHVRRAIAENASPATGRRYEFNMASGGGGEPAARAAGRLVRAITTRCCCARWPMPWRRAGACRAATPKRWQYGEYLRIAINNPVIAPRCPLVGKYFDIGPVPMSGSTTTVKQTTRMLAPSMRMNADLGDWDRSLLNMQIGQSGQILSSHYKDQWADLLHRPQLSHAVRQSGREEHAGIQAVSELRLPGLDDRDRVQICGVHRAV